MTKQAILVLEDGSVFEGYSFGADTSCYGEVVFNTSMTGYQEILTDPSYAGQIVVLTYPLIGNYGINWQDFESQCIQVRGFVLQEDCSSPSHWQSISTLHQFLLTRGISGITGVDTRALTRRLRTAGVMMGIISSPVSPEVALKQLSSLPRYDNIDFVKEVSTKATYRWETDGDYQHHIVVLDCGLKYNILRSLRRLGCSITVVPCTASAEEILRLGPDGILLSPGPGDPTLLGYIIETVRELIGVKPIMGICLGHQLLGRAWGGKTFKLKFGHRGGNHPVKDLLTGKVHITAQNHGYAVDGDSVRGGLEVTHINLNDGTVEGLRHREMPVFSIQYHPEASPGPQDNMYLFEQFVEMVRETKS